MSTTSSVRYHSSLVVFSSIVSLTVGCAQEEAAAPPPPAAITAERGRPIADQVLIPWMEYYGIPGVSIAVASGDAIDWAKGYGVADAVTRRPVTPDTIFQAASISKPIAAVTALAMFDEMGLDLDDDVRYYLETWRLPENELTRRAPVTMRLLLSHSAGFNVHGFAGYSSVARLPSLVQILDGVAPANNEPIRVSLEPGAVYRYSGGGYQVVQQLLEDLAGGTAYAALVQARVFDPAEMSRSSLLDPLDPDGTATAHGEDGRVLSGRWHRYPELSAAAVWTTPSDLLRFATRLQLSYRGVSDALLPGSVTREMLARQRTTDIAGQSIGLGVFLEGPAAATFFQHSGGNVGYRCYMFGYLDRPLAIAIMTNSEVGDRIVVSVVNSLVAAYS
jgi:CubicO group peptidase (beta-lactamase class C family)